MIEIKLKGSHRKIKRICSSKIQEIKRISTTSPCLTIAVLLIFRRIEA